MYEFDLDEGLMVLTFDDAIDLPTFNPDQISLQNTPDATQMSAVSYTLTGFQVPPVTADNYVLNLTLSQTDLNNIKALRGLARNQTSTYLTATGSTVSDLFNNPLDSLVPSQAQQTTLFTPDITFPNLVEYSLDLDIGALVISFDETVAIETFVPSEVVIQNVQNASEIGAVTLGLSTAGYTNPNGTSMFFTYYLDNRDVNFIKEMMEVIGSELNNTFLSISSAGISDVEGNPVVAIEPDNALMASSRALDTSPPFLTSFSFNLNSGLLELSFSESVSGNSTMPQSFYLLSSPSMSATRYQLQGGVSSEDDSPTVQIQLTTSDLNNIKAAVSLATSRETTYLAFFSDAVTDLSGNGIGILATTRALVASDFVIDSTNPRLDEFDLNLDEGTLILTFSETVNASSFDLSGVVLQAVENAQQTRTNTEPLRLTPGAAITPSYGPILTVHLDFSDLTFLQSSPDLVTDRTNTFLTITQGAITDVSNNPVEPIFLNGALQVDMVVPDVTGPQLLNFTFDLNSGSLLLTFSEVVVVSSIVPREFTIQSQSILVQPYLQLRGGEINSTDGTEIQLVLENDDLNELKIDLNFATNTDNTFLSVTTNALMDTSNNRLRGIGQNAARPAADFIPDTSPPRLQTFDILTVGTELRFILYFSETVNGSSLNTSVITLQPSQNDSVRSYTLQTAMVISSPSPSPRVTILVDVNEILSNPPIGQSPSTTFITLPSEAIADVSGNLIEEIPSTMAVMATNISTDFVPPRLQSFLMDLTAGSNGIIQLTFSEPINVSSIDVTRLTLQNSRAAPTENITFTGGAITMVTDAVILVSLSRNDSNIIKATTDLAVSRDTTFISAEAALAVDFAGIDSVVIPTSNAIQAAEFEPDRVRPQLEEFELDLTSNLVTLSFSETVNVTTFMPQLIAFQNTGVSGTSTESVVLTGGVRLTNDPSSTIEFTLTNADKDEIRRMDNLAVSIGTTFITIASDGVYDMNNNRLFPVTSVRAQQAAGFTGDGIRPELSSYQFNLNTGVIRLSFDETIDASSVVITNLLFEDSDTMSTINYTLSDSVVISSNSPVIEIQLGFMDMNEIKRLSLCTFNVSGDCFLSFPENTTRDMVGHGVLAFTAAPPTLFVDDTTSPQLVTFQSFNLSNGEIVLAFSETVNVTTFQPQFLILQTLHDRPLETYTLTGGTVTSTDDYTLSFVMDPLDLLGVKELQNLCTYRGNCYIRATANAIMDMSGNLLVPIESAVPGRIVDQFAPDIVPPELLDFDFNLDNGTLILTFDEPMSVGSLDTSGITFLDQLSDLNTNYTLTGGTVSALGAAVIQIELTTNDLNTLKFQDIATAPNMTFISLAASSITDQAGNALTLTEMGVGSYTADSTPPELIAYTLNLQTREILLTFDEPVDVDSAAFADFMLCRDMLESNCSFGLSNSTVSEIVRVTSNAVVRFALDTSDGDRIEIDGNLATSRSNTYLRIMANAISDLFGNGIEQIPNIQATLYVSKSAVLTLDAFDFNMERGVLSLTFSGIVDTNTFNPTGLVFQASRTRGNGPYYALTRSTFTNSENGAAIEVILSLADMVNLNSISGLATSADNTYLTMRANVIDDTSGGDVLAVTDGKALRVSTFTADTTRPTLTAFGMDLDLGLLNLTFSEAINTSTLTFQEITLLNDIGTQFVLTGGVAERSSDGSTAIISLTVDDLNMIKSLQDLATNDSNTFISITNATILDLAGNPVIEISLDNALNVSELIQDTTLPILLAFDLDMNNGSITFTFSETIDLSSFNASGITFQDARNGSLSVSREIYTLTGGIPSFIDLTTVRLPLSNLDLLSLRNFSSLVTRRSRSFLVTDSTTVTDNNGNSLSEISNTAALGAGSFIDDFTPPTLLSFSIDLENRLLQLIFDDSISLSQFNPAGITLQNESTTLISGGFYTLACGSLTYISLDTRELNFCSEDFYAITLLENLAIDINTTYISLDPTAFADSAGVAISTIDSEMAQQAVNVTEDTSGPILSSFTLDLNATRTRLLLTFDEVIRSSTVMQTEITFQAGPQFGSDLTSYTLQSSTVEPVDSNIVTVTLSADDLNGLVLRSQLATRADNTFINITAAALYDYYDNPFDGLDPAVRANRYIPDTAPPELVAFDVDMNASQILLTFSESVNVSTLDTTQVILQNADSSQQFALSRSSFSTSPNGDLVVISVGQEDFNTITANTGLYTGLGDSYISLTSAAITDASSNPVLPVSGLATSSYIPDRIPPELSQFEFDLNTGILLLTFSETVSLLNFNPSGINFVNFTVSSENDTLVPPADAVSLSMATPMRNYSSVVELRLTLYDLNAVKATPELATDINTTFILITSDAVTDVEGNPVAPTVIRASDYTPDTENPFLVEFRLDLASRVIIFDFNEALNPASIDILRVGLQSASLRPGNEVPFTFSQDSAITLANFSSVVINLSLGDYTGIVDSGFCTGTSDCFATFSAAFVNDTTRRRVVPVTDGNARQAVSLTEDTTRPMLVQFVNFDFDAGQLFLNFTEEVRVSSFNLTVLNLRQSFEPGADGVTLMGGEVPDTDNSTVLITLTQDDLNRIKSNPTLCRQRTTCAIRFTSELVMDIEGNMIMPVEATFAFVSTEHASMVTPDSTPPVLQSYVLNMNTLRLTFTFNEIVDSATFQETELTFQDGRNRTVSYTLTDIERLTLDPSTIVVTRLRDNDAVALKARLGLATSIVNTYITFNGSLIRDVGASGTRNFIRPISDEEAIQAANYIPDMTPPSNIQFTVLDIDSGFLQIRAEEPLSIDVNVGGITLQQNIDGGENHTLLNGDVSFIDELDRREVRITISDQDLQTIKLNRNLGSSPANSFLVLETAALQDTASNQIAAIPSASAIPVIATGFMGDTTPPRLLQFNLDMNTGILVVSFDDIVNTLSLEATRISILGSSVANENATYQLTSGSTNSDDGFELSIQISMPDLNAIKSNTMIATEPNTTYISITAELIADLAGLNIVPTIVRVTNFVEDTTRPELRGFNLNVNEGTLTLSFTEAIEPDSFNITEIRLQNRNDFSSTEMLDLTGGTITTLNNNLVFIISLTVRDLNSLKEMLNLGTNTSNTFISLSSSTARDFNGNQIREISSFLNALGAEGHGIDMTPPTITGFDLNIDTGELVITFSETVRGNSLVVNRLILQSAATSVPGEVYQLTTGTHTTDNSIIETVTISTQDLNNIKRLAGLAISNETTYIRNLFDAIEDTNGIQIAELPDGMAIPVSIFTTDSSSPQLTDFSLNLNDTLATLILTFSETVLANTLDETGITLLNTIDGSPTTVVNLTSGTVISSEGPVLTLQLNEDDSNAIKIAPDLGTRRQDTFLSVQNASVLDREGNQLAGITFDNAIVADSVTPDEINPNLLSVAIDLDAGRLNLTFDEVVDRDSFNFSTLTLLASPSPLSNMLTLDGGNALPFTGSTVSIELTRTNLNAVKLDGNLCSTGGNCYLFLTSDTVTDIAGNEVIGRDATMSLMARFTPDSSPPLLESFDVIGDQDPVSPFRIILHFNEPVVVRTGDVTSIQLIANNTSPFQLSYNLTADSRIVTINNGPDITINIHQTDLEGVLALPPILQRSDTTFLQISAGAFEDLLRYSLQTTAIVQVSNLIGDFIPPELSSWTLDFNTGTVILSFSEEVNASTAIPTRVILQDSVSRGIQFLRLPATAMVESGETPEIVNIQLNQSTIDTLLMLGIGLANEQPFLSLDAKFVQDLATINSSEVPANAGLAGAVIPDTDPTTLTGFSFQYNPAVLTFTFTKAVNVSTFDPTFITLQGARGRDAVQYTLTGGTVPPGDTDQVQIQLTEEDRDAIQSLGGLAESAETTFVSLTSFVVIGLNGLRNSPISPNTPLMASSFGVDQVSPSLRAFDLDLNTGTITFRFDETVNLRTFRVQEITIQDGLTVIAESLQISGGSFPLEPATEVNVTLTNSDYNYLQNGTLCSLPSLCFITYTNNTITDSVGNGVNPRADGNALPVSNLTDDTTSPQLVEFVEFNLNTMEVRLLFNEPVNISNFDISGLRLQSLFVDPVTNYTPIGTTSIRSEGNYVIFTLSDLDLIEIKQERYLCSIRGNCYVWVLPTLITDISWQ